MATERRRDPDEIRAAIVDAAVRLIGEQGVGSLTHRGVAAQAGVSLSSTTYHFASKADIVAAALRRFVDEDRARAEEEVAVLRGRLASGRPPSTKALVDVLARAIEPGEHATTRAGYELALYAAGDPDLEPIVREWFDFAIGGITDLLAALGSSQPARDARILVATIDGLRLDALTTARSRARTTARRAALARLLELMLG